MLLNSGKYNRQHNKRESVVKGKPAPKSGARAPQKAVCLAFSMPFNCFRYNPKVLLSQS